MIKNTFVLICMLSLLSCRTEVKKTSSPSSEVETSKTEVLYAKGFEIEDFETHKILKISNPWPDADQEYTYLLKKQEITIDDEANFDAVLQIPLKKIVVTSTTHIPSLEMLEVDKTLIGFPNLDYISSDRTRARIDQGVVHELGKNEDINMEVLIDLSPDAVVTFAVKGGNKSASTMEKAGIPVLYNSDWTETHPLGKAEWIKFFGALFDKEEMAGELFSQIELNYKASMALAAKAESKPTVLSGAMYKDIWYLPQGDSWAAQFIKDAHGKYLWEDSEGTGSISLNLESVLEQGKNAQFWIGPGQFTSYQQMIDTHAVYGQFDAFQHKKVFSFTTIKGATGGVLYYELAPNRPDIVLKDIIKILHPELLPNHELYFFSQLD
ncbi:MAG: ABC transporter substrate-binding protein [Bacteroidota bacterium]